jgi:hypothetical protein
VENVLDNIRAEAARRHWSIAELCEKLGIERTRFYYWDKSKDFPVSYLKKMTELFQMSADELLGLC